MPYYEDNETVSSPRYRWSCQVRGAEPFVILQWTRSGEGIFESRLGAQRVPPGSRLPGHRAGGLVLLLSARGARAVGFCVDELVWAPSRANSSAASRRASARWCRSSPRGAAAAALRRVIAASSQPATAERSQVSVHSYGFLLEWWREAASPAGGREDRLARAVQFCRQHFREPLGVKEIAPRVRHEPRALHPASSSRRCGNHPPRSCATCV